MSSLLSRSKEPNDLFPPAKALKPPELPLKALNALFVKDTEGVAGAALGVLTGVVEGPRDDWPNTGFAAPRGEGAPNANAPGFCGVEGVELPAGLDKAANPSTGFLGCRKGESDFEVMPNPWPG